MTISATKHIGNIQLVVTTGFEVMNTVFNLYRPELPFLLIYVRFTHILSIKWGYGKKYDKNFELLNDIGSKFLFVYSFLSG